MTFSIAFGQHVDANGQINFAGADMAGSSYLPGEAVFLPASMAATEAFTQPDLPPAAPSATSPAAASFSQAAQQEPPKKTAKSKSNGKKSKAAAAAAAAASAMSADAATPTGAPSSTDAAAMDQARISEATVTSAQTAMAHAAMAAAVTGSGVSAAIGEAAVTATIANPDILQFPPCSIDPNAGFATGMQLQNAVAAMPLEMQNAVGAMPLETYEAYTAAVASAAGAVVDLDSETDSNHDTALTLACAGGHEELVTLLISRGANIGKFTTDINMVMNL